MTIDQAQGPLWRLNWDRGVRAALVEEPGVTGSDCPERSRQFSLEGRTS